MVKRDIFRKLDWTSAVSSVTDSNSDGFFSVRQLKYHVYVVLFRTIEDHVARRQAAPTKFDANMLKSCSTECRAAPSRLP
jgi:hypothetical protein